MLRIIYTPQFKLDLIEINQYISSDNVYYSLKVLENISNTINLLLIFPKIWKKIDDIHYMIIEKNYKYKIVYKIKNTDIIIMWVFKYKNNWQ